MKPLNLILAAFIFGLFYFPASVFADTIFSDSFEDPALREWVLTGTNSQNTITSEAAPAGISPVEGSRVLKLSSDGSGSSIATKQFSSPQQGTVSVRFYDPSPDTAGGVVVHVMNDADQIVMLGVNPNNPGTYYYRAAVNNAAWGMSSGIPRTLGWHKFELVVTPKGSYGKIDDVSLSFLPNKENGNATAVNPNLTNFTKLTIAIPGWNTAGKYYFDDLKIQPLPAIPTETVAREKYFLEKYLEIPPEYSNSLNNDPNWPRTTRAAVSAYLNKNIDEAKNSVKETAQNYSSWTGYDGENWIAGSTATSLGTAAWLLWPQLDPETKTLVKNVLFDQGEKFLKVNPRSKWSASDSTATETNAAISNYLLLLARMFPQDPKAAAFEVQGKKFAFHTFTRNELYGGVTTQTIGDNYLINEQSLYPNVTYAIGSSMTALGFAASYYLRTGQPIPDELKHNVTLVFDAHKDYINSNNYRINFISSGNLPLDGLGGKDDWNADATYDNAGFAYNAYLTSNTGDLSQLLEYELNINRDFLTFPQNTQVVWPACRINNAPAGCQDAQTFFYSPGGKYWINSYNARSHLISAMLFDNSLSLPQTETAAAGSSGGNGSAPPKYDLNKDGVINSLDVGILFNEWSKQIKGENASSTTDFNGDRATNSLDYSLLTNQFGKTVR